MEEIVDYKFRIALDLEMNQPNGKIIEVGYCVFDPMLDLEFNPEAIIYKYRTYSKW